MFTNSNTGMRMPYLFLRGCQILTRKLGVSAAKNNKTSGPRQTNGLYYKFSHNFLIYKINTSRLWRARVSLSLITYKARIHSPRALFKENNIITACVCMCRPSFICADAQGGQNPCCLFSLSKVYIKTLAMQIALVKCTLSAIRSVFAFSLLEEKYIISLEVVEIQLQWLFIIVNYHSGNLSC